MFSTLYLAANQTSSLEYHQVLGDCVQRYRKILRDVRDPSRIFAELLKNCPPSSVGDRAKYVIESTPRFNHKVEYIGYLDDGQ